MPRKPLKRPTDGELEILSVLWEHGPSTVRFVHDVIIETRDIGYSTVLKIMQLMTDKGLLIRDTSKTIQRYHPAQTKQEIQRRVLKDMTARAFGGSTQDLVLQALSSKKSSPKEVAEIRRLLDQRE